MLEILIMIGVIGWFFRTAKQIGQNGFLWAVLGALSYYLPVIVVGWFLFPALVRPVVTYGNQFLLQLLDVVAAIVAGIGCCAALKRVLTARMRDHYDAQHRAVPVNRDAA